MRALSGGTRQFHAQHPVGDMLGFDLNHPRVLLGDVCPGRLREDTYRADLAKLARWGIRLTVVRGAVPSFPAVMLQRSETASVEMEVEVDLPHWPCFPYPRVLQAGRLLDRARPVWIDR